MAVMQGVVNAPSSTSSADGTNPLLLQGKAGEGVVAELHGKWYTAAYRSRVFSGSVAAVTLPTNASNLVSVFSLFNPANSPVNLELLSFNWAYVVATTVVNGIGLYYQRIGGAVTIPTSQTAGTVTSGLIGNTASPQALFLSAATHVGTPVLGTIMGYTGAVTSTAANINKYEFDGKIIVPPNTIVSIAMTTAASTASGFTGSIDWCEWPL